MRNRLLLPEKVRVVITNIINYFRTASSQNRHHTVRPITKYECPRKSSKKPAISHSSNPLLSNRFFFSLLTTLHIYNNTHTHSRTHKKNRPHIINHICTTLISPLTTTTTKAIFFLNHPETDVFVIIIFDDSLIALHARIVLHIPDVVIYIVEAELIRQLSLVTFLFIVRGPF